MALLDFLKNKKDAEKSKKPAIKKAANISDTPKVSKKEAASTAIASKSVGTFSYELVGQPHISEKSTILSEKNQYVFMITSRANKPEIRKAVEGIYRVNVLAVNVIQIPKKKRRLGKTEGYKKAYRKAIVTIKEGQKIEVF